MIKKMSRLIIYIGYAGGSLFKAISKEDLIAIILYTDYSELSAMFTSTFRKNWTFEPLSMTKRRNSEFWWWSKLLIDTVQYLGMNNIQYSAESPFFTGMSMSLNMPSFCVDLYSPTSTTLHQEVAMKFATEEGIIVEFRDDKLRDHELEFAKAFDVSSISRYREEEERYILILV